MLRDIEVLIAVGKSIAETTKLMEISKQALHQWRKQDCGMKEQKLQRLKELEKENQQLKRLVADQGLEVRFLKDIAEGNFKARRAAGRREAWSRKTWWIGIPSGQFR